jgi:hypothetical protein
MKKERSFALCATLILGSVMSFAIEAAVSQDAKVQSDEVVKTRVETVLKSDSDLGGTEIAVAVNRGIVTLSGSVSSDRLRDEIDPSSALKQNMAAIVRLVPGVKDVRFSLEVSKPNELGSRVAQGFAPHLLSLRFLFQLSSATGPADSSL